MTPDEVKVLIAEIGKPKSRIAEELGRTEQWIHSICRKGCDKLTGVALKAYKEGLTP